MMVAGRRVRVVIEFDGTGFHGWQFQLSGERTVQGVLAEALSNLPGTHSRVQGAGRTDAGVHALALVGHFDTTSRIEDEKLRLAMNAHLPGDVAVLELTTVEAGFEAQFSCHYRRYLYRMRVVRGNPRGLALDRKRVLALHWLPDTAAMQEAALMLEGRRDFASFGTQETGNTVRELYLSELRLEHGELRYHVAGSGFLRGMVRAIVGTLLWVGKGKLRAEEVLDVLAARDRRRAGHSAPAHGLYFMEAGYVPFEPVASAGVLEARQILNPVCDNNRHG